MKFIKNSWPRIIQHLIFDFLDFIQLSIKLTETNYIKSKWWLSEMENNMANESHLLDYLKSLEPYYINAIIFVGILGNSFSFYMFSFTKLK
jgi:hypothetical protein